MAITTMDRAAIREIDAKMREALEAVAAELGLELEVGGGSFDPGVGTFKPKVTFKLATAGLNEWARWAPLLGLEVSDLGREFESRGRTFTIVGVAPRSTKYPVLAKGTDGRTYKFTEAGVRRALRGGAAS